MLHCRDVRSDTELLDAWAAGDQESGRAFYGRFADRITRFFARKLHADTADLVQRTFLKALEAHRARPAEDIGNPAGLLFAIARNELYDAFRARRRAAERFDPDVTSLDALGAAGTGASTAVARHEQQRLLLAALRRIPLDDQLALELYYWEELPMADVARVLGITRSGAINRVHRARGLVRDALEALETTPAMRHDTVEGFETWARSLRAGEGGEGNAP
jgi:RNA polymerase sigma-70 factor (ECF subfamily)